MIADTKKRPFWYITFKEILALIFAAAVPIALAIYTAVSYYQEQQRAEQIRQFDLKQATELRQQVLYDDFLKHIYEQDKDGYLNDSKKPWPFPNAFYRAAHRQWDIIRIADVLQFLKEKKLIGRNNCSSGCRTTNLEDIIRLEELSFDNIHLTSQTGTLSQLNLDCVSFIKVSMTNAAFSFINFDGASFGGRLNNAKFDGVSLVCVNFSNIDLSGADFGEDSDLTGAYFYNANLTGAKLTEAQRNQAKFYNTIMPDGSSSETSTSTASTKSVSPSTSSKKITTAVTTKQITARITTPIKVLTSEGKLEPSTTFIITTPTETVQSEVKVTPTTTFTVTTPTKTVTSDVKLVPTVTLMVTTSTIIDTFEVKTTPATTLTITTSAKMVTSEVKIVPSTTVIITPSTETVQSEVKIIPTTTLIITTSTERVTSEVKIVPSTTVIITLPTETVQSEVKITPTTTFTVTTLTKTVTSDVKLIPTATLTVTTSTVIDTFEVKTTPATALTITTSAKMVTSEVKIVPTTTFAVTTSTKVATSEVKTTPATTLTIATSTKRDTSEVKIVPSTTVIITPPTETVQSEVKVTPTTTFTVTTLTKAVTSDVKPIPTATLMVTTSTVIDTFAVKTTPATTLTITMSTVTTTSMVTTMKVNAKATPICADFNDIPGRSNIYGVIPNGYKNLNWTNAEYIDRETMPVNSGYRTGVNGIGRYFVAHSPDGNDIKITPTNGTKFSLYNITMISAWKNFLGIDMSIVDNGNIRELHGQKQLLKSPTTPSCSSCSNIDAFIVGVRDKTYPMSRAENGTQFIITKLCFSFDS